MLIASGFKSRNLLLAAALAQLAWAGSARAQSGPNASSELVAAAAADGPELPGGSVSPTWDSIRENYKTPKWFTDAKFGIMMHWGLYSVSAHASEWYGKHMYGNKGITDWHTAKFGPPDKFGYKDFIPKFTVEKWDPEAWAALFKKSGAKYIIPTAIHHDGFALWDSQVNKWNAKAMGPKRDLIGDLGVAVRGAGLKYGVSHHGIEHFTFIQPTQGLATDLNDPAFADFYSVADRSDAACQKFLTQWVNESVELIDKYHPDILWYDNGINARKFDPIKLKVAAYYYNQAKSWNKEVSLSTKGEAYLAGTIADYERAGRAPKTVTTFAWQVDDPVLFRFGYTEGSPIAKAPNVIRLLIECASKNGNLLLNISPKGDGTIPEDQTALLLDIGKWLDIHGDAIYGTRPWTTQSEGKVRFTTKGDALYAIHLGNPGSDLTIPSCGDTAGKVTAVSLIGSTEKIEFSQDAAGLKVKLPAQLPSNVACALKIVGLPTK